MSEDGKLKPRFFEDVRALFERLDSPAALGRACEAAVRAPLPSLGDVKKLLQVICARCSRSNSSRGWSLI